MPNTCDSKYAKLEDGEQTDGAQRERVLSLARWQNSVLVLSTIGMVVVVATVGSSSIHPTTRTAPAMATELREKFPYEVMPQFQGSTPEYGGYGYASGGHFHAKIQHLDAGSKSTDFLLDH